MTIALLNALRLTRLVKRKPTNIIITTITTIIITLEPIDEERRPMMTLLGIKEKGRRRDMLYLSLD